MEDLKLHIKANYQELKETINKRQNNMLIMAEISSKFMPKKYRQMAFKEINAVCDLLNLCINYINNL